MVRPVEAERRAPIMADEHQRAMPDHGLDKAPQKVPMRHKAVGIGTGVRELVGIAHAEQIRRHAAAEPSNFGDDVAPEVRSGGVAVQKETDRLTTAELDIGYALGVDGAAFPR